MFSQSMQHIYNFITSAEIMFSPISEYQLGFQVPASPTMEGIVRFHDELFLFLAGILGMVSYMFGVCIVRYGSHSSQKNKVWRFVHASQLEIIWTIIPALILVVIAIPSFSLLYSTDEIVKPVMTVKVVGHQWYWSYETFNPNFYSYFYNKRHTFASTIGDLDYTGSFDSYLHNRYMLHHAYRVSWVLKRIDEHVHGYLETQPNVSELMQLGGQRMLSVDNYLWLPTEANIRVLITSADVLHSWAVPSLGVKLDACPGRLNQTSVFVKRQGIYYGQCSELCGVNHGFMPIGILATDLQGLSMDSDLALMLAVNYAGEYELDL